MAILTVPREASLASAAGVARVQSAAPNLSDVFRRAAIASDLEYVERLIAERTASRSRLLSAAGAYTMAAGGKRLRAVLVLLAAKLGAFELERAARPAVAIELLHAASLVHDDLVDHTFRRRGRITVHARWDSHVALMLGDYFFALAAGELAAEPDPRIITFYADAAQTVVEGELHPVTQLEPLDVALGQYFYKTGSKTAALFQAACQAGIAVSGGTAEQIEAMSNFGYHLGMAFQVVDDVLDFVGDEATLGKPAGNDLREGTLTLPLIYAVTQSQDPLLRELVRTGRPDPAQVPQLLAAVIASGGIERALDEARHIADRALTYLHGFERSSATRALSEICDFVLSRKA